MTMLSGYSPSLLKYVLEDIVEPEPEPEIVVPTPLDTYNRIMNDTQYHPIREILHHSQEKCLKHYLVS